MTEQVKQTLVERIFRLGDVPTTLAINSGEERSAILKAIETYDEDVQKRIGRLLSHLDYYEQEMKDLIEDGLEIGERYQKAQAEIADLKKQNAELTMLYRGAIATLEKYVHTDLPF